MNFELITCPQWNARQPFQPLEKTDGPAKRFVFHHTAGHHPEIDHPEDESRAECIRFALNIQHFHMYVRHWNDSGHNFLVCRNGIVLQGRWGTVTQIQLHRMVVSAHCPGQNDQIGIEHEHKAGEKMTVAQAESSAQLQAWIASLYDKTVAMPVEPHSKYIATRCPDNLLKDIPGIRARAQEILTQGNV